jgi:hypothetical protein
MKLAQFRKLIVKTLQESSGRGRTAEQVADIIIQKIELAQEIMGDMDIPILPGPDPIPEEKLRIVVPEQRIDVSQRIRQPEQQQVGLVERYTPEQLIDFAKNEMPSSIKVQPPEFEQAFEIKKCIDSAAGGAFVRITYQQEGTPDGGNGQRIGPTVQIGTTDEALDADALTEAVIRQANGMYTKTPKVLVPRMPSIPGNPGDLRGALGAEAPDDARNVQIWNERVSDTSSSTAWRGMRKIE